MIPQNTEAERHLLSSFVNEEGTAKFDEVASILDEADFYDLSNQTIFKCMKSIALKGADIDEISLSEELKRVGLLDRAGGIAGVLGSTNHLGIVQHKLCAETIKEKSNLRTMIKKFKSSVESMEDESRTSSEVSADVEAMLLEINDMSKRDKDVKNALQEVQNEFKSMLDGTYKPDVIKTHISHLDEKLSDGGIGMGEVCVIAAPTSCGKSQLALNMACRALDRQEIPALVFSFEMPQKQILKRLIHAMSGVNPRKIRDGVITEDEQKRRTVTRN